MGQVHCRANHRRLAPTAKCRYLASSLDIPVLRQSDVLWQLLVDVMQKCWHDCNPQCPIRPQVCLHIVVSGFRIPYGEATRSCSLGSSVAATVCEWVPVTASGVNTSVSDIKLRRTFNCPRVMSTVTQQMLAAILDKMTARLDLFDAGIVSTSKFDILRQMLIEALTIFHSLTIFNIVLKRDASTFDQGLQI